MSSSVEVETLFEIADLLACLSVSFQRLLELREHETKLNKARFAQTEREIADLWLKTEELAAEVWSEAAPQNLEK